MVAAGMGVLALGSLMVTLTINMVGDWDVAALCTGTTTFCDGVYWQAMVTYMPAWLFVAQILVVLAMASPVALVRR